MSKKDQPKKQFSKEEVLQKDGSTVYAPHQGTDTIRWHVEILREDTKPAQIYVTSLDEIKPLCQTFLDASHRESLIYGQYVTISLTVSACVEQEHEAFNNEVMNLVFCEGFGAILITGTTSQKSVVSHEKKSQSEKKQPTLWITKFGNDRKALCLNDLMLEIKHCNFLDKKRFMLALNTFIETRKHGTADKPYTFNEENEKLSVEWEEIPYRWCNQGDDYT